VVDDADREAMGTGSIDTLPVYEPPSVLLSLPSSPSAAGRGLQAALSQTQSQSHIQIGNGGVGGLGGRDPSRLSLMGVICINLFHRTVDRVSRRDPGSDGPNEVEGDVSSTSLQ
jgi:hypothetical protein